MAFFQCHLFSDALGMCSTVNVILPQASTRQIGLEGSTATELPPVLYLLHGLSDDQSIWMRRTSIERYVASLGIAVVMPNGHRSFYQNMDRGPACADFITEELPALMGRFFRISQRREDTFVAGLSMGGYGAFHAALSRPERYAGAASLSGALDMVGRIQEARNGDKTTFSLAEMEAVYGDLEGMAGGSGDLFALLRSAVEAHAALPALFAMCGEDDFLLDSNRRFADLAGELGVALDYRESPGAHMWAYWDRHIQDVLAWMTGICARGN